jgi:hypothetical protein
MMTRKDYVATAEILNQFIGEIDSIIFQDLVYEFSQYFKSDNERFDEQKFSDACEKELENA